MMINPDVRDRILTAAQQLFDQSERREKPTVDAVRRLSRTSMNDASAVMRDWRRMQSVAATPVLVTMPDPLQQLGQSALSRLWQEAQKLASESLLAAQAAWDTERAEAEKLRIEISAAFESQGADLDALRSRMTALEEQSTTAAKITEQEKLEAARQIATATDQANVARARAEEIEKRADDLKIAVSAAHASASATAAELDAVRQQHESARSRSDSLSTELATLTARLEAQSSLYLQQLNRANEAEVDLASASNLAAAASVEAAVLRSQVEELKAERAGLLQALEQRSCRFAPGSTTPSLKESSETSPERL